MFTFRNKPEMNLVALIGASCQKLSKYSVGSVNHSELVGFTADKKADALGQLNDWYAGLAPHRQERLEDVYNEMAGWKMVRTPFYGTHSIKNCNTHGV
jgi:hypothetical protein